MTTVEKINLFMEWCDEMQCTDPRRWLSPVTQAHVDEIRNQLLRELDAH